MIARIIADCLLVFPEESIPEIGFLSNLELPIQSSKLVDAKQKPAYFVTEFEEDGTRFQVNAVQREITKEYCPDSWIVDLIYLNYEKLKSLNLEEIVFTFVYEWVDQCNFDYELKTIKKISKMNAILCVTCTQYRNHPSKKE